MATKPAGMNLWHQLPGSVVSKSSKFSPSGFRSINIHRSNYRVKRYFLVPPIRSYLCCFPFPWYLSKNSLFPLGDNGIFEQGLHACSLQAQTGMGGWGNGWYSLNVYSALHLSFCRFVHGTTRTWQTTDKHSFLWQRQIAWTMTAVSITRLTDFTNKIT